MTAVHVVVPYGIDDEQRPSGGNVYDRQLCGALAVDGWTVVEHRVPGAWPRPDATDLAGLGVVLRAVPTDGLVVVDGLLASAAPEALQAVVGRLRLVVLVHAPLGDDAARPAASPAEDLAAVRRAEAAALSAAVAVVTTSRWSRQWLLDHYDLPAGRVHVAEPGTAPGRPAPGTATGGELLCVAAVIPGKGHDILLAALATLTDLTWRCRCLGALDLAPDHVATLRRQASAAGLAERVCFAGPRTGADLEDAYAAADLLVLASRAETYGLVVTEALAHGLPVVATAVGGVPEAIGHADGTIPGRLVAPGDPVGLAAVLRRWLENEAERAELRRAAQARSATLPRWSATAATVARLLTEVAA